MSMIKTVYNIKNRAKIKSQVEIELANLKKGGFHNESNKKKRRLLNRYRQQLY